MVYPKLFSKQALAGKAKTGINIQQFSDFAALRPRQWTKNLIVFAAPLFAFSLSWHSISGSLLAFIAFCCASSGFYLINDIVDVESDRQHPVKCQRPIAAGQVKIPAAIAIAFFLVGSSLLISWLCSPTLGAIMLCYNILQIAYNLKLKKTLILDIFAIATGFVLRAYGGAAAANVALSSWFLLCTAMLALFLGIEKRKAELRLAKLKGRTTRTVLKYYSLSFLNRMENIVTTGTLLTYSIWSSGPQMNGASTPWMMITLPLVFYGVFRYQFLSDPKEISRRRNLNREKEGLTERPEEILLTDRPILLTVIAWIATILTILLLKHQGWIK